MEMEATVIRGQLPTVETVSLHPLRPQPRSHPRSVPQHSSYSTSDSQGWAHRHAVAQHGARMVGSEIVRGRLTLPTPPPGRGFPALAGENYFYIGNTHIKMRMPIPPTVKTVGFLGNVFCELKKQKGINKIDIRDLAWYRYGRYSTQPLVVFLRDGRIFKIRTRKGKILIEKIK